MPFHFHFNLREEFEEISPIKPNVLKFLKLKKWANFTIKVLKNLRIKDLQILSKLTKHPKRFERAMYYLAFEPGDDIPYPPSGGTHPMISDYYTWKSKNTVFTFKDQPYFIIKEDFFRDFVTVLDKAGLYLIIKFGCDSKGENLSILLAGMAKGDDTKMSDRFIECTSSSLYPVIKSFGDNGNKTHFEGQINNFSKRLSPNISPKKVGVAHNTKTITGSPHGLGFLEYYLQSKFKKDQIDEDIFIHPAWDSNHQNNFTVIFSGKTDLTNISTIEDWEFSRVYDYGQSCCPPQ